MSTHDDGPLFTADYLSKSVGMTHDEADLIIRTLHAMGSTAPSETSAFLLSTGTIFAAFAGIPEDLVHRLIAKAYVLASTRRPHDGTVN